MKEIKETMIKKELSIKGLTLHKQFINQQESKELWELIQQQNWSKEISRDTIHYGMRYDYKEKILKQAPSIPEWLTTLVKRVEKEAQFKQSVDQIIINRYCEGQGIAPHVDHIQLFGDTIATLSLGRETIIFFKRLHHNTSSVLAESNSLIVLKDEARYKWTHSLKLDKNNKDKKNNNDKQKKKERISITFRTINK